MYCCVRFGCARSLDSGLEQCMMGAQRQEPLHQGHRCTSGCTCRCCGPCEWTGTAPPLPDWLRSPLAEQRETWRLEETLNFRNFRGTESEQKTSFIMSPQYLLCLIGLSFVSRHFKRQMMTSAGVQGLQTFPALHLGFVSVDYILHSWRWRIWLQDNQKLGVYVAPQAMGDSCASGPGVCECECEWVGWLLCMSVWVYCTGLKSNHSCYCFTSQTSWARGTGSSFLYTNLYATQCIRWIICKCLPVNYHVLF